MAAKNLNTFSDHHLLYRLDDQLCLQIQIRNVCSWIPQRIQQCNKVDCQHQSLVDCVTADYWLLITLWLLFLSSPHSPAFLLTFHTFQLCATGPHLVQNLWPLPDIWRTSFVIFTFLLFLFHSSLSMLVKNLEIPKSWNFGDFVRYPVAFNPHNVLCLQRRDFYNQIQRLKLLQVGNGGVFGHFYTNLTLQLSGVKIFLFIPP